MADFIKREAAINTQERMCLGCPVDRRLCYKCAVTTTTKQLLELPAADVRPVVHGEWLPTNDANKLRCSKCDIIHLIAQYPHGEINYCPNCGADMREAKP